MDRDEKIRKIATLLSLSEDDESELMAVLIGQIVPPDDTEANAYVTEIMVRIQRRIHDETPALFNQNLTDEDLDVLLEVNAHPLLTRYVAIRNKVQKAVLPIYKVISDQEIRRGMREERKKASAQIPRVN